MTTGTRVRVRSGLYTSYAIVQKHSGDIEVTSTVGQGTTFILKLPIYPTSSILPETPLTTAATAGGEDEGSYETTYRETTNREKTRQKICRI